MLLITSKMAMQTNVNLVDSLSHRCLCYSIVEDVRYPIIRIPLRKVTRIGKVGESLSLRCLMTQLVCDLNSIKQYERGPLATATKLTRIVHDTMQRDDQDAKENNRDAPYTFENVSEWSIVCLFTVICMKHKQENQTHYFSLKYAHAVDVLTEIHEFFVRYSKKNDQVWVEVRDRKQLRDCSII